MPRRSSVLSHIQSVDLVDLKPKVFYKICKEAWIVYPCKSADQSHLTHIADQQVPKDEHLNIRASSWMHQYSNSDGYMLFYANEQFSCKADLADQFQLSIVLMRICSSQ